MLKVINNISKISILVIFLGYLNIYFYYYFFGIEIYNFLDSTEIIFSFSSLIPTSLILITMLLFSEIFHYLNREEREAEMKRMAEWIEKEKLKPEKKKWSINFNIQSRILRSAILIVFALILTLIFLFGLLLIIATLSKIRVTNSSWNMIFELSFAILVMFVYVFYPRHANKQKLYLGLTVLFSLFLVIRNNAARNSIVDGNPKYFANIQMQDGTSIVSNDSIAYVGSTRQYHFFHNINSKENFIIPNSTVKEIKMKELRGGL